jgi:hypothetical protein
VLGTAEKTDPKTLTILYEDPVSFENKTFLYHSEEPPRELDSFVSYICTKFIISEELVGSSVNAKDYCLRKTGTYEVITEANFANVIQEIDSVLLTGSVPKEAHRVAQLLSKSKDPMILKKTIFHLQKVIKDAVFYERFTAEKGVEILIENCIKGSNGNLLAYSLNCLACVLENDFGWKDCLCENGQVKDDILSCILQPVFSKVLNVCRASISILIKLVNLNLVSVESLLLREGTAELFSRLLEQLNLNDFHTQLYSLQLINALFKAALYQQKNNRVLETFDDHKLRSLVMRMPHVEEVSKHVTEFQRLFISYCNFKKESWIPHETGAKLLADIWKSSGIPETDKWKKLGFQTHEVRGTVRFNLESFK